MDNPDQDEMRIRGILHTMTGGPDGTAAHTDAVTAAAAAVVARPQPQPTNTGGAAPAPAWRNQIYPDDAQPAPEAESAQPRNRSWMRIPPWWSGQSADLNEPTQDADDAEEDAHADAQPAPPTRSPRSKGQRRSAQPRSRSRKRSRSRTAPRALLDAPQPRRSLLDAYDSIPPRIRWLILHGTAAAAGYRIGWVDYSTRTAAWIADHGALTPTAWFWYGVAIACECLRHRTLRTRLPVRWLGAVPIASIVTGTALYGTGWTHLELPL